MNSSFRNGQFCRKRAGDSAPVSFEKQPANIPVIYILQYQVPQVIWNVVNTRFNCIRNDPGTDYSLVVNLALENEQWQIKGSWEFSEFTSHILYFNQSQDNKIFYLKNKTVCKKQTNKKSGMSQITQIQLLYHHP